MAETQWETCSADALLREFFAQDDLSRLAEGAGALLGCPLLVLDDTFHVAAHHLPLGFSDAVFQASVRSGEITEQEALSHPKREALISYCGIRELSMVEINLQPLQLKSGDVIVLCSDGLYRLLSRQEMIDVLQETAEDMNLAAFKLTAAATDKNFRGQDNTSVILIKIK